MKMKCYGSGSRGNCYLLDDGKEALLLECGTPFAEVVKDLGTGISRIRACLVTHEHKDHAGYIMQIVKYGIPVYATAGTIDAICCESGSFTALEYGATVLVGGFVVSAFKTIHDAAEPCGFLVSHSGMGIAAFATDTCYLPQRFVGISHLLIECNYYISLLDANCSTEWSRRNRVVRSHMELETCEKAVKAHSTASLRNVVLLHLSDENSDESAFLGKISAVTRASVYAANKGFEIELNENQF